MLADGVDFHDIRAAFQKLVGDVQKIRKGQLAGRTFKKCRAAARNQKEHRILFS